ncbi:MAG: alpha/beta hydrolase [Marinosulfonomonas sp.]|nr:alpha/beta hydrolase [Marinosulfonomonas sp.]
MKSLYLPKYKASIRWHEVGQGSPHIIFLPGMGFPAVGNFLSVATHPEMRGSTNVMIDFIGSGISDYLPDFPATIKAHAECIEAVLDHIGCGPCPVLGYSFGGSVAAELAAMRPDLVSRLILAEGNLTSGGGMASRHFASFTAEEFAAKELDLILAKLREGAAQGDDFLAFIVAAYAHVDPLALHAMAQALVNIPDGFIERFLELKIQRTYIYGENNHPDKTKIIAPDMPDPNQLVARGVHVATVPDVGHEMMLGNLDGFVDVLLAALIS